MNIKTKRSILIAAAVSLACTTGSCASTGAVSNDGKLSVLASFYPLQFVTEQVGGDLISVESLTPQGAEPHDLELSPAHTREISTADLVIYQSGFQAAVDDAIQARNPEHVYDAGHYAETAEEHAEHTSDEALDQEHADHDHESEDHSAEEHDAEEGDHDGHDHGSNDPHFWLDPTLLAEVAQDIAEELTTLDPDNGDTYAANATTLVEKLEKLDTTYAETLGATCTTRTVVVTHEAFGYLAHRYDFEQLGISGIDPEAEPSPATIRKVRDQISDAGITTIFFETLTSPKVAQTIAKDLGIDTAVLDPIEGLVNDNTDYFTIMDANLDALKTGMNCA